MDQSQVRLTHRPTADQRLEAIERWSRRTFYATALGAACLLPMGAWAAVQWYIAIRFVVALADAKEAASPKRDPSPRSGIIFDPGRGIEDLKRSMLGGGR